MTTVITKSDRIIKVVSREEWKSTITTFLIKLADMIGEPYMIKIAFLI